MAKANKVPNATAFAAVTSAGNNAALMALAPKGQPLMVTIPAPKTAAILRAAALVAKHGIAGQARAIAATGATAASLKRYPNGLGTFGKAFAATTFALTPLGRQAVAVNGCIGAKGQATAMGLTALALGNCGGSATGQQVALAILGNPAIMGQMVQTKANGVHILPANTTAAQWAQGYVNGLCRPAHGLATR